MTQHGPFRAEATGRRHALTALRGAVRDAFEEERDQSLEELEARLAERGIVVSRSALSRFFQRHGITRNIKTAHAIEQDRPDVSRKRRAWFSGQPDLDPRRLVFVDETWTATNMARTHGRCWRGERQRMGVPHGHRETTTFVAGLRLGGIIAPMVINGSINGDWFEAYVAHVLAPTLGPGDVVLLEDLSSHKRAGARAAIGARGARLRFLPPYNSDLKPIEPAFAKLKALLRKAAERTVEAFWDSIGTFTDAFSPHECANYFTACGYEPD